MDGKREQVKMIVEKAQRGNIQKLGKYVPPKYRDIFPDGGRGNGWSRHYDSPESTGNGGYTTEKGIEEIKNERL